MEIAGFYDPADEAPNYSVAVSQSAKIARGGWMSYQDCNFISIPSISFREQETGEHAGSPSRTQNQ
jgi:hypothetical protein